VPTRKRKISYREILAPHREPLDAAQGFALGESQCDVLVVVLSQHLPSETSLNLEHHVTVLTRDPPRPQQAAPLISHLLSILLNA
jgi:hypothetical protein